MSQQYSFGSGVVFGRKTGSNPTPARFGALQDVSIDISFTTKELYGQYQYPLAIGRGTAKITGKAKFGQFDALLFNDLFFGNAAAPAAGEVVTVVQEAQTVASNTATVTHNGVITDYGVLITSSGQVLQRVASAPSGTGNYSVNETTGVYTFNSANNAVAVQISYGYTDAGNGYTVSIANQLLGSSVTFGMALTETFSSNKLNLVLNACLSNKLSLATKLEDFTIPEFDFQAFADSSNNIGTLSLEGL